MIPKELSKQHFSKRKKNDKVKAERESVFAVPLSFFTAAGKLDIIYRGAYEY